MRRKISSFTPEYLLVVRWAENKFRYFVPAPDFNKTNGINEMEFVNIICVVAFNDNP